MHSLHHRSLRRLLLAGVVMLAVAPAVAADVTPQRLTNPEPGNWLMNHRTYDAQRYSPLDAINKTNIKGLKLAYAVAIGGTSVNENLESTPLAEDGFLYVVDLWGVVYKIDARSGDVGRIVWRMDPGQEKVPDANRGVALWGNFVVSVANHPARLIATNKETGKVVWETNISDGQNGLQFTAAPLAVKDKIVLGASGGDNGVRTFILALDAATGWTMPSSPRQCRSAPAQGRTWIFPESRTILGTESPEMRKAVSQGDGRHVGLRART
jgi:alcohol dehydrogenase (cytochrome c)